MLVPHYEWPRGGDAEGLLGWGPTIVGGGHEVLLSPALESVKLMAMPANAARNRGLEWGCGVGEQEARGRELLLVNVTVGVGAGRRMFAAGTLGCSICCDEHDRRGGEAAGPFRLLGHYVGGGRDSGELALAGTFSTIGRGRGWYAAASLLPSSWRTLGLLYAQDDFPGCAVFTERDGHRDADDRTSGWGARESSNWISPLFPFAFQLVPAPDQLSGSEGAREAQSSNEEDDVILPVSSVEWRRVMAREDEMGRGRWKGQVLQPLDYGVRCENEDRGRANELDLMKFRCHWGSLKTFE